LSISKNVKGSVELNRNILCAFGLSKGRNSGMTENINLELPRNDKEDDQKGNVSILPLLLLLPPTITTATR